MNCPDVISFEFVCGQLSRHPQSTRKVSKEGEETMGRASGHVTGAVFGGSPGRKRAPSPNSVRTTLLVQSRTPCGVAHSPSSVTGRS